MKLNKEQMEGLAMYRVSRDDSFPDMLRIIGELEKECSTKGVKFDSSEMRKIMEDRRNAYRLRDLFKCLKCFNMDFKTAADKESIMCCKKGNFETDSFKNEEGFSYNRLNLKLVGKSLCCEDYEFYEDFERFREDVEMEKNEYIFYVKDIKEVLHTPMNIFITKKKSWEENENMFDDNFPQGVHQEMFRKGMLSNWDGAYEMHDYYQTEESNFEYGQKVEWEKVKEPLTSEEQVINFMESLGFEYNKEFGERSLQHFIEDIKLLDSEWVDE